MNGQTFYCWPIKFPFIFYRGFFNVEKVPAKVIPTKEEIVSTYGMHFYHRSLYKPISIAFLFIFHVILLITVMLKINMKDFIVPFKMSDKMKPYFLTEQSHIAVSSWLN